MRRRRFLIYLLAGIAAACGRRAPAPGPVRGQVQRGLASWYGHGDGYHGKRTASGEKFDKNKLTAAHFDLPFGTQVRVQNLKNNRKVKLKINDRFPIETSRKGRILDVSYEAAKKLDMVRDGVVPVLLEVLSVPRR